LFFYKRIYTQELLIYYVRLGVQQKSRLSSAILLNDSDDDDYEEEVSEYNFSCL